MKGTSSQCRGCATYLRQTGGQDIVDDFATLKQLHGNIPDNVLQNSMMYKANKIWAEKLKTQGYTVIDIGYPDGIATSSIFYNMELTTIYK